MVPDFTREQLKRRIDRGQQLQLVDALSPAQFEHSHLPGAVNLPADEVAMLAPRLLPDKTQLLVVYGAHLKSDETRRAAEDLINMGYHQVVTYRGGKKDWVAAGFPLVGQYANLGQSPEEAA